MILRPYGIAGRAVCTRKPRMNPFERFDEFEHIHFESGFFREFSRDALRQCFPQLEQPAGDRPLAFERRTTSPDQQRAPVIDHHAADAHQGLVWVFSFRSHLVLPASLPTGFALYNMPEARLPYPNRKEVFAVVRCPKCASEIDVDEDEVEEGEILACPECETEMEVVQIHPVKVNSISDEDDEDEEDEESDDGDDVEDEDDEEEEEEQDK